MPQSTAKIRKIEDKEGVQFFPITHVNAVVDENGVASLARKVTIASSQPVGGLEPGVLYNLGTLTGSVTIDLATPTDATVVNEYAFTFTTNATAPTITWPASVVGWAGNCLYSDGQPLIKASRFYEVSILNGIGVIIEVDV